MLGEKLLQKALQREQEDQRIYKEYSKNTTSGGIMQLLTSLRDQEAQHEKELSVLLERGDLDTLFKEEGLSSITISQYTASSVYSPDMSINNFLNHVIEREESGVRFYSALAGMCSDEEVAFIFNNLSFEEQKHKTWAVDRYELEMLSSF